MKTSQVKAVALVGLESVPVVVEVSIMRGLPSVQIVGLPDASVQESKERVRSALVASGFLMPRARVTISLAPAEVKKNGSAFDLPIAVAILLASGDIPKIDSDVGLIGELGLDGSIRSVRGGLAIAIGLKRMRVKKCFTSVQDARLIDKLPGLVAVPHKSLFELVSNIGDRVRPVAHHAPPISSDDSGDAESSLALDDLIGMQQAKRALMIAAAGSHNLILRGPPGTGKSSLARCLPDLLPTLNRDEQVEVNSIWNLNSRSKKTWLTKPPFCAPHHSSSAVGVVGGGPQQLPGYISLFHRGVLFMDEFTEFRRDILEQLRQPLEEGEVTISRAHQRAVYPASFQLVCAANPCPCGFSGDKIKPCTCTPATINRYQNKISGPILDRIDLSVWVDRVVLASAKTQHSRSEHASAKRKVSDCRWRQQVRAKKFKLPDRNSLLSGTQIRGLVPLTLKMKTIMHKAETNLGMSPRGFVRVLKVARTIADLESEEVVKPVHLEEALSLRAL